MSERISEAELRSLAAHRTYDDGARLIAEVRRLRALILKAVGGVVWINDFHYQSAWDELENEERAIRTEDAERCRAEQP